MIPGGFPYPLGANDYPVLDDGKTLNVYYQLYGKWATFQYTPSGELPACDSAQVVKILADIWGAQLAAVVTPRSLGSSNGKNFCAANNDRHMRATPMAFTVEWVNQAQGRYWVQVVGVL